MDLKNEELEDLWGEFEIMREIYKNNKKEDNFIIKKCKVCNCDITMSYKYEGKYPLCYKHRDPNNR